jgi:hypothetical protein
LVVDRGNGGAVSGAAKTRTARWKKVAAAAAGVVVVVAAVVIAVHVATNPGSTGPNSVGPPSGANSGKTCPIAATSGDATTAIQTAIEGCASGGTVRLAAGVYAISSHFTVKSGETITGAGPTSTFIVQHARQNIFQITAPGVTIENLNLNTATYNASAPVAKNPDPGVLYSNASHTSVISVTGETGSGFGMRVVGPNPCSEYPTIDTVMMNINMTTTGKGGFAAVDVDCTNGAQLSNITIHGGILALYKDENVTLNGEDFTPGPDSISCEPAAYITGPATNITIADLTSSGAGVIVKQPASAIVTRAITAGSGCLAITNKAAPPGKSVSS